MMIYREKYLAKIRPFVGAPFVKILTGVRRAGKSTLLAMIAQELKAHGVPEGAIVTLKLDSLEYEEIATAGDLFRYLKARLAPEGTTYFFLDEIQEIEGWEKAVNSLFDLPNVDMYVTGSNSRMFSSEIATYLSGRYVAFQVYPLTFSEYLDFRAEYANPGDRRAELERFMRFGGFPSVHVKDFGQDEAYAIIRDIHNSVVLSDIVRRSGIRRIDLLERIVKYAFDNLGQTFSASSLSKYLKAQNRKVSPETVYGYVDKLEKAFILHRCPRYDIRGKEHLKTLEKFYAADPALRYALLGYRESFVASTMENIVYLELASRGYRVEVGKLGGTEINFVAERAGERVYVQVCERVDSEATHAREYGNLMAIADNYPKYVVRRDVFEGDAEGGIITMHLADFLMLDSY